MSQNNPVSMNFGAANAPKNGTFIEVWRPGAGRNDSFYASFDAKWGNGRGSWFDMLGHAFTDAAIGRWRMLGASAQERLKNELRLAA